MKLKKVVVSILLLTLLLSVFLSVDVTAMAEDAPQEATLAYSSYEPETNEEAVQNRIGIWVVAGCTVMLAICGVLSINCQKIYDSEK